MTTTTETAFRVLCGSPAACLHYLCGCGAPIRRSNQRAADHPGTVQGFITDRICETCRKGGAQPDTGGNFLGDYQKQRLAHIEALPTVDARLRYAVPGFYNTYLLGRRKDGVPPEGYLFPNETPDGEHQR